MTEVGLVKEVALINEEIKINQLTSSTHSKLHVPATWDHCVDQAV